MNTCNTETYSHVAIVTKAMAPTKAMPHGRVRASLGVHGAHIMHPWNPNKTNHENHEAAMVALLRSFRSHVNEQFQQVVARYVSNCLGDDHSSLVWIDYVRELEILRAKEG